METQKDSENQIEAEDDFYSDDDLYNITSWGADLSFRELITMYDEEELIKPELQRKYVWEKFEASRFIESLLMGLPVPSVILSKVEDETRLIIDGYQRIMTVYDYVNKGIFSKDGKVFKLSNSEGINKKWRGKSFNELSPTDQKKIKNTTIHAIIFEQKHPKDEDTSLYQVFERINTGGRLLLPQEIRNCVYQGIFNASLIELNKTKSWRKLYGAENDDPRMKDVEHILRFFALKSDELKRLTANQISLKKFLNKFMGNEESKKESVIKEREQSFIKTMDFLYENLGIHAFHNINESGKFIDRFHQTIFDSISISTAKILEKNLKPTFRRCPSIFHNFSCYRFF